LDSRLFRFSIRSFLAATILVAVLVFATIEYSWMTIAVGGGDQSVSIQLSGADEVSKLQYALIRHDRNTNRVVDAFASNDPFEVYNYISPELVVTIADISNETELIICQQWSINESGFTKRRSRYTQLFDKLVFHVKYKNGYSTQQIVELPKYGQSTKVDLSK